MTSPTRRAFWQGARDSLPFLIVVVPFGMIFGVLASEAGWTLAQTLGMSVLVIAGASQFTALQLLAEQAPLAIAILTALAVNLRMAMYSASIAPYIGHAPASQRALAAYFLTDQTYGVAIARYTRHPPLGPGGHMAYFLGCALPVCGPWYVATWAGAVAGAAIPEALALDFAVPVTFIALVAPGLRTLPNLAAATVSVAVALALSWLPYSLWLLVAAVAAMLTGAFVELRQERAR
jgi:predicted branched-subunit amino acid permease